MAAAAGDQPAASSSAAAASAAGAAPLVLLPPDVAVNCAASLSEWAEAITDLHAPAAAALAPAAQALSAAQAMRGALGLLPWSEQQQQQGVTVAPAGALAAATPQQQAACALMDAACGLYLVALAQVRRGRLACSGSVHCAVLLGARRGFPVSLGPCACARARRWQEEDALTHSNLGDTLMSYAQVRALGSRCVTHSSVAAGRPHLRQQGAEARLTAPFAACCAHRSQLLWDTGQAAAGAAATRAALHAYQASCAMHDSSEGEGFLFFFVFGFWVEVRPLHISCRLRPVPACGLGAAAPCPACPGAGDDLPGLLTNWGTGLAAAGQQVQQVRARTSRRAPNGSARASLGCCVLEDTSAGPATHHTA